MPIATPLAPPELPVPRWRRWLPRGSALPEPVWRQRHRGILVLLWLHVPAVLAFALFRGVGLDHAVFESGIVLSFAIAATAARSHRWLGMVLTSMGLMTCSATLVHLSDGLIEMHFHYFVMVGVVTLYQDWRPFLVAIAYVVVQHGVAGALVPESVYNHPEAVADPWRWAGVHGFFILGMSVAGMVMWRLNESLLDAASDREHKLAEAQEVARLGSWEWRFDTDTVTWSAEMYRLFDVDERFEPTGASVFELVHPEDRADWAADMEGVLARIASHALDFRIVLSDGTVRWLHGRGDVTRWDGGAPAVMTGTVQDVTERRHSEDALRGSQRELLDTLSLLSATLDATADGILVVDREGQITSYNGRFVDMWRIPAPVLAQGRSSATLEFVLGQLSDPAGFMAKVEELYAQPETESHDTLEFADGRVFERVSQPQRVDGRIVGRVWSFRDVTERKRLEDELAHQAFHDSLTGLANQALFRDRVGHALARLARGSTHLAVAFIDVDNFKTVNDSLGHVVGDQLLVAVTERLVATLRDGDTAARLGGDEFALLIEDISVTEEAIDVLERVLVAFRKPFTVGDKEVFVTASVGIAVDGPTVDTDHLLRNADLAMYTAKRLGKDRCQVFSPEMHTAAVERLEMEGDLRRACERDELRLHFQPIVDLASGVMTGVEALVRWQHPVHGLLAPDRFLQVAEESGLIASIGDWVLREACAQARRWQVDHPRREPLRVAVNMSPRQLHQPTLVADVAAVLDAFELAPGSLMIEITEGAMMHDTELSLAQLQALKRLGVLLAVDDFGTGYSSLSYLERFPIDVLKIDRSFVQRIDQGQSESSLARTIIRLAQSLQMVTVAEGVETAGQVEHLARLGCTAVQGFHVCRPTAAAAIDAILCDETPLLAASVSS